MVINKYKVYIENFGKETEESAPKLCGRVCKKVSDSQLSFNQY